MKTYHVWYCDRPYEWITVEEKQSAAPRPPVAPERLIYSFRIEADSEEEAQGIAKAIYAEQSTNIAYHLTKSMADSHAAELDNDQKIGLYARLMRHFQSRISSIELQQQRKHERNQ